MCQEGLVKNIANLGGGEEGSKMIYGVKCAVFISILNSIRLSVWDISESICKKLEAVVSFGG